MAFRASQSASHSGHGPQVFRVENEDVAFGGEDVVRVL